MPTLSRSTGNVIVAVLALALVAGLVIRTSSAVFNAETDNNDNSLGAGTVVLTDTGPATALLAMTNIAPGEFSRRCIRVNYEGSLDPEAVKVFSGSAFATVPAASGPGTAATAMEEQVRITIEQGDPAATGDGPGCGGFVAGTTLVDRERVGDWHTRTAGASVSSNYAAADGTWNPTGAGQSRLYRITLELDLDTGNSFQGARLDGIGLTWATRSTTTPGLVP